MDKSTAAVVAVALLIAGIVAVAAIWLWRGQAAVTYPYAYGIGVPSLSCSLSDRWNWSVIGHFAVNTTTPDNLTLGNTLTVANDGTGPTQNQVNVRATLAQYPTDGDDDVTITLTPASGVYANKVSDTLYILQQLGTSSYTGLYVGYSADFDVDVEFETSAPEGTYVVAFTADTLYTPLTYTYYSTQAASQCGSSMVISVVA